MMAPTTDLSCTCGTVRLKVTGTPIIASECHCNSCREAGERLEALPGAPKFRAANGGTPFALYRSDRVEVTQGQEHFKAFLLGPKSTTRRVVATCCNTPVYLHFKGGHWLSLYESIWPQGTMPPVQLRTMTSDLPNPDVLDNSVPNGKRQSVAFFAKLLGAWIGMGFKSPRPEVNGEVEA